MPALRGKQIQAGNDLEDFGHELNAMFAGVPDSMPASGTHLKQIRDMTTVGFQTTNNALVIVGEAARAETKVLRESLEQQVNDALNNVAHRIDDPPRINAFGPFAGQPTIQLSAFSGRPGADFSAWFRRFQDVVNMADPALDNAAKLKALLAFLDGDARDKAEDFKTTARTLNNVVFSEGDDDALEAQVRALVACEKDNSTNVKSLLSKFLDLFKPRTVFATVSTFLISFGEEGALQQLAEDVETIYIDEASQLQEVTFKTILAAFPNARFVLIGDEKQLPPYVPNTASNVLRRLGSRSILDVVRDHDFMPAKDLENVFRSHPAITSLLSSQFYANRLHAVPAAEDRLGLVYRISMLSLDYPIALLGHGGYQRSTDAGSWENRTEADAVKDLAQALLKAGFSPEDTAVITPYRAQRAPRVEE